MLRENVEYERIINIFYSYNSVGFYVHNYWLPFLSLPYLEWVGRSIPLIFRLDYCSCLCSVHSMYTSHVPFTYSIENKIYFCNFSCQQLRYLMYNNSSITSLLCYRQLNVEDLQNSSKLLMCICEKSV